MLLVTGGLGFIGSNFIKNWFKYENEDVINIDNITYSANEKYLNHLKKDNRYNFLRGNIGNEKKIISVLNKYKPRAIINFAAETHVDNSILNPQLFFSTNVLGTCALLNSFKKYIESNNLSTEKDIKFIHISTDEVFGTLGKKDEPFKENDVYKPNSPYSASKASSDHLVRSFLKTYNLPAIITHCSNNYGPNQYKEKLIPLCVNMAINNQPLPIYGDGSNIRDWLHVDDHCDALRVILKKGTIGEVYNIGGENELTNIALVKMICKVLDELKPRKNGISYSKQIKYVKDRPGHDFRYSVNISKIKSELNWYPKKEFMEGLKNTISWCLFNQ